MTSNTHGYGTPLGKSVPIERPSNGLVLGKGGLDFERDPIELDEGQTPNCVDVRLDSGGVSTDFDFSVFGSASASAADKNIMALVPFELVDGTKLMMRMRPTKWDRWNGTTWLELGGTLTGTTSDRLYTVVMQGRVVGANMVDKLKSWDGVDGNNVVDLSADAPIAAFITRIGTRMFAARIKVGSTIFPYNVAWCADGDITNWTTLGAGGTTLIPEGSNKDAGFITGLGTVEGGVVVFKQKGLQLGSLTGVGSAPFRFTTVDFQHGTESPWSICAGGAKVGLYFLGDDYMMYHFDGNSLPTPIGIPIYTVLKTSIANRRVVMCTVDSKNQELWVGIPTDTTGLLKLAYIFSIKDWIADGRLVWRKKSLGAGYRTLNFGNVPTTTDPFIDDVPDIVDTVNIRVDDFANTAADERIVVGNTVGQAYYLDTTNYLATGLWDSRPVGDAEVEITTDLITLFTSSPAGGEVEVSISNDGGLTFLNPVVFTILAGIAPRFASDFIYVTGALLQFRLRILSGLVTISKIGWTYENRGRAR